MRSDERLAAPDQTAPTSASGHQRKSVTTILMSVKPPKAEVVGGATVSSYCACADVGDPIPDQGAHHFTKVQHPFQPLTF